MKVNTENTDDEWCKWGKYWIIKVNTEWWRETLNDEIKYWEYSLVFLEKRSQKTCFQVWKKSKVRRQIR